MINQITNYKELLQEKARLKGLLAEQELQIKEDWQVIKEDLKPYTNAAATIRNFFTRKATVSAMQLGVNIFADGFVKKVLLGNTGWLIRTVVPFFIKNYASHLTDEPEKIIHKIKNFFKKKPQKEKETVEEEIQETGMEAV
ncbi:hypothetical protein A4H97_05390 [Niastella yeongjuensis]|uniref:Uncharacterized protein n=1 Tax=Niastella yeongjuensis TaxID=354355 RepID=A0A1V9EM54_9BACT|nr:hypothetical protein [Niastella yeongjuensis]OQP46955.1 hypothetical protein A4H97_05390 [Niastella yeongjuensis]SEN62364.1 hypothetical protein SAMN05660816_01102 [Niastella yeongjuensis]